MKLLSVLFFQLIIFTATSIYSSDDYISLRLQTLSDSNINLVQDLTIGDADSEVFFGNWPLKIAVGSQGRIFVADPQSYSLKAFSNKGGFIQEIGREGRGPKEFGYLRSIDTGSEKNIYVMDSNDRISTFDEESLELINDLNVPRFNVRWSPHEMKVAPEGFIIVYNKSFVAGEKNQERSNKISFIDKQGNFIYEEYSNVKADQLFVMDTGSSLWRTDMPFGGKSYLELGNDGIIYFGWSKDTNIVKHSLDKKHNDTVNISYTPIEVTSEDLEDVLEYPPTSRQGKALREDAQISHYFPAYDWFVVDDKNRIWIAINTEDRENYSLHIYDKDGDLLDNTSLPKSVQLQVVRDGYAYGVQETEDGIQTVVRYKVNRLNG